MLRDQYNHEVPHRTDVSKIAHLIAIFICQDYKTRKWIRIDLFRNTSVSIQHTGKGKFNCIVSTSNSIAVVL
jgi:hypothetical protein